MPEQQSPSFEEVERELLKDKASDTAKAKSAHPSSGRGAAVKDFKAIETRLTGLFGVVGTVTFVRDQTCGTAILEGSPKLAEALTNLAKENKRVKLALDAIVTTSAWGEVAVAAFEIALPIMQHHDLVRFPALNFKGGLFAEQEQEPEPHRPVNDAADNGEVVNDPSLHL